MSGVYMISIDHGNDLEMSRMCVTGEAVAGACRFEKYVDARMSFRGFFCTSKRTRVVSAAKMGCRLGYNEDLNSA